MKAPRPPALRSPRRRALRAPGRTTPFGPPQLRRPEPLIAATAGPLAVRRPAVADGPPAEVRPNPYVDFQRRYTAEGGVEFTYKDIDDRWRWTILRCSLWLAAMTLTAWFAFHVSPLRPVALNVGGLASMGVIFWLIVRKPVEIYRTIEVRPDALIFNGEDVFFRDAFELGWPTFVPAPDGNLVLSGTSGTRAVEYAKVRRFDEFDRGPEVLAAHLRAAMQQLWSRPGEH